MPRHNSNAVLYFGRALSLPRATNKKFCYLSQPMKTVFQRISNRLQTGLSLRIVSNITQHSQILKLVISVSIVSQRN